MKRLFQPQNPFYILVLSIWFGLFFGFVEATYYLFLKFLLGKVIFQSQQLVWMIPLMLTILFIGIGFLLFILYIRWKFLAKPAIVVPFFVFPGLMALYYVKPRLHLVAALLLASGIALQSGRMVAKRPEFLTRLVSLTLPLMGIILIILMIVMPIYFP